MSIMAGTLDGDPGLHIAGHIYCNDKGTYYDLEDRLPQSESWDPNLTDLAAQ